MIEMSAPFSTVLPFFISAPLCNFVVVGIIIGVFGLKFGITYFLWTFSCAIVAGLTLGRSRIRFQVKNIGEILAQKAAGAEPNKGSCSAEQGESGCSNQDQAEIESNEGHKEKAIGALQFAFALFKVIIPYVIVGAVISGVILAFVPNEIVEKYVGNDSWFAIPLAAAISIPLYLRIEMAVPLLITLFSKGMGMGAAAAILISGTGASLPEFAILSSMLKPKGVLAFALTVYVIAVTGGFLFMFLF